MAAPTSKVPPQPPGNGVRSKTREGRSVYAEIWRRFLRHRLGVASGVFVALLGLVCMFAKFVAPFGFNTLNDSYIYAPPQRVHIFDDQRRLRRPFVYDYKATLDENFRRVYASDTSERLPIYLFPRGAKYRLFGLIPSNRHLFGTGPGNPLFLFGTDALGRDMVTRILFGGQISLSVGVFGVFLSVILGTALGLISGYFGGVADTLIQRIIEVLKVFPTLPLWMALSAALPATWNSIQVYFGVVTVLSLIGWADLGRQVRGMVLSLREQEYVMGARALGADGRRVMRVHIFPNTLSHVIASATLAVPGTILGESTLSFLGLGIRPPMTSWGVLLSEAQNLASLLLYPWLLIPGLFIILTVLAFNFLGDGIRDAADPYAVIGISQPG